MSRYFNPIPQYFDDEGNILSGGKIYFYESGTNTLQDTFSDVALTIANTNPIVLDSDGRLPGDVFLSGSYKVRVTSSDDTLIRELDPVTSGSAGLNSFSEWSASTTYSRDDIVLRSGKFYISLDNGNINNDPETSATDWSQVRLVTVTEGALTDGTTATIDQLRPFASEAEVLAGTVTDKTVAPDTLQAKFDNLATVASTGAYSDLTGTPSLATVATSGSYNDLIDKPDIPAVDLDILANTSNLVLTDSNQNQVILNKAAGVSYSLSLGSFSNNTAVVIVNTTTATNVSLAIASATTQRLNNVADGSCFILPNGSAIVFREDSTNFWVQGDITDVT